MSNCLHFHEVVPAGPVQREYVESICDRTCFWKVLQSHIWISSSVSSLGSNWKVSALAFASSVGLSVPEQSLVDAAYGTCLSTDPIEVSCVEVYNCLGASLGLVWSWLMLKVQECDKLSFRGALSCFITQREKQRWFGWGRWSFSKQPKTDKVNFALGTITAPVLHAGKREGLEVLEFNTLCFRYWNMEKNPWRIPGCPKIIMKPEVPSKWEV